MFYYNINGEEMSEAPPVFQYIFQVCPFVLEMGKDYIIFHKNNKNYKLNITPKGSLKDFVILLMKRYNEVE